MRRPQLRRLIIRPGAIGDCIVSLPALEHLKSDYTEVWTAGQNVPLIRFADHARSIVSAGIDAYPPRIEALYGFDEIVSWYGTNRADFRASLSAFPVRFLDALPQSDAVHAVDYYMRQVGGADGAVPRIEVRREAGGFIAIHPFSGSARKNWPHFHKLIQTLEDVQVCVSPEQQWPGAAQFENLYELARWLASASLYIGNDSGITHLAAAVGTPVIAIFQASNPAVWAPRGKDVMVLWQPAIETVTSTAQSLLRST